MADGDLLRGDAQPDELLGLFETAGPVGGVGVDGCPGGDGRGSCGLHALVLEGGDLAVCGGHLDDARLVSRPVDDRTRVVVGVDALGDVGDQQVGDLVDGVAGHPVRLGFQVDVFPVETGGRHHVQVGDSAVDLGQLVQVAPAVGGAHVDDRAGGRPVLRGRDEAGGLLHGLVDVRELVVGIDVDLTGADPDEVVVGVDHAETLRGDVSEDGANELHSWPPDVGGAASRLLCPYPNRWWQNAPPPP